MPALATTIVVTNPKRAYAGSVVPVQARFSTFVALAQRLIAGSSYTSLATGPLPAPITSGQILTLAQSPAYSVQVTASGDAVEGATTVNVQSFAPLSNFTPGASLTYAVDPDSIEFTYSPGKGTTPVSYFFPTTAEGIVKVAQGLYQLDIDTTIGPDSKIGSWNGAVESFGVGQAYMPFSFSVSEAQFS